MPVAWYLAPVALRATDRRPERYCPVDDALSARGIWDAGEILGGYYVVRASGTAGQLDAVDAVAGVEVLPRAATLTTRLATLTAAQRNRLLALANNLGYTAQEISDWRARVGDAVITLFHLFEFLAQRRRRPRWDDVAKQIVLDGPIDPVFKPWAIGGGAFPTTSVIDAFTRADAANLGSNWTGMLFPRFFGSELKIVSNTARPAAVDYCDDWYNVATYGGDSEAYVTITTLPSTEGNQVRVDARIASPGASGVDCYEALVVIHTAGNEDTRLYRIDNDTATQLGATDTTLNWASGDALGIECIGTTITLYRKPSGGSWGSVINRTDSTYSAAGYIGCGVYQTGTLDDFGGGTIASAATSSPIFPPRVPLAILAR